VTVTPRDQQSPCALCSRLATEGIDPPRRTLDRGLDPSDQSYSITVILPEVMLCAEHALQVHQGDTLIGWCDDEHCRIYGEVGETSPCGAQFQRLASGNRSRSTPSLRRPTEQPEE
jgi:hypothetical protein